MEEEKVDEGKSKYLKEEPIYHLTKKDIDRIIFKV